jgi:hypothetical protein
MKPATIKALKEYYQLIVDLVNQQVERPEKDLATCKEWNSLEQLGLYYIHQLDVTALVNFEFTTETRWRAISCTTVNTQS